MAVGYAGGGRGLATRGKAHGHEQKMIDRARKAAIAPSVEVALRCRHRREVPGQHPPRKPLRRT
jgi:hypothetical protein